MLMILTHCVLLVNDDAAIHTLFIEIAGWIVLPVADDVGLAIRACEEANR